MKTAFKISYFFQVNGQTRSEPQSLDPTVFRFRVGSVLEIVIHLKKHLGDVFDGF